MKGEPIESVNTGLGVMMSTLRRDPYALETVYISMITFDTEVRVEMPLTHIEQVNLSHIEASNTGFTFTGAALEELVKRVDSEVRSSQSGDQRADFRPLVFLMTDGKPGDMALYEKMIGEIKKRNFGQIIGCAAGPAGKVEPLKLLTSTVVELQTMDSASFTTFFEWVSQSVAMQTNSRRLDGEVDLPPPPPEINLAV
jgi:uncharacterized protein YegL